MIKEYIDLIKSKLQLTWVIWRSTVPVTFLVDTRQHSLNDDDAPMIQMPLIHLHEGDAYEIRDETSQVVFRMYLKRHDYLNATITIDAYTEVG